MQKELIVIVILLFITSCTLVPTGKSIAEEAKEAAEQAQATAENMEEQTDVLTERFKDLVEEDGEEPTEVTENSEENVNEENSSEGVSIEATTGQVISVDEINSEINSPPEPEVKPNTIYIEGLKFNPLDLTVNVGDTIVWINKDPKKVYMIYSIPTEFRSPRLEPGMNFNHTFTKKGEFIYGDAVYKEYMKKGTIKVI